MSGKALAIGLDIGTSGVRAIALDSQKRECASGRSNLAEHGDNHRDPAAWWSAASAALRQLCSKVATDNIVALAVDATSGTVLACDAAGQPVAPALMYNDPVQDTQILQRISAHAPQTSAVHGAASALARALLLQTAPGCARLLHQADWIAGQLSGRYDVSDESNALKTGYDPIERRWPAWLAQCGLAADKLPRVVAAGTSTGTLQPALAAQFGLPQNLRIVSGVTDGCASFLATGADQIGDCVTALGSTITMKILCDKPLFCPEFGIYSHRIGNRWLAGGASNSGGNVLGYYFDARQIEELSAQMNVERHTGLKYYPLLQPGERFPHNDANWPPQLTPRPVSDAVFLQGLLESMADIETLGYQRLAELGAPAARSLRTVGTGASNPQWTSLRQQRIKVPFLPSASIEAAAGVARLALPLAAGN